MGGGQGSVVRRPSAVALWLALVLFGIYLFSFSGNIISSDGLSMFAVTDSFVKRSDLSTDQMFTFFATKSAPAPGGEVYSKYGYGTSLFAAPFYLLALSLPFAGLIQLTVLSSAVAVVLAGALVYLAAQQLNFSHTVSVLAALLFGLATPAWVYGKEFWSESFALLTLFGAFYFLLVARAEGGMTPPRHGIRRGGVIPPAFAGILLGLAIAVRTTNVLLVPLYATYAFVSFNPLQIRWRGLAVFLLPVVLSSVSVLAYNALRFGNPLTTGYRADETFSNPILLGAYGLLFSPGKGLMVYAPFFAALPFGIWQFYGRFRREMLFSFLFVAFHLLLFSAWYYWWGGTNWAARFLVPTLPFLVLLCAPLLELILSSPDKKRPAYIGLTVVFALLVLSSFINELAGVSINSLTYRLHTLGLSSNPDWDAIFVPALSPLIGSWQIFQAKNLDFAWMRPASDTAQFDWIVIALTITFLALCIWGFIQSLHGKTLARGILVLTLFAAVALSLFSVWRYADDPRLNDNKGYQSLVTTLISQASPDDVLILNDDAHARYFFNANRAVLKWYGLSRDPARWDAATQQVIANQIQQHPRVWFAYDDAVTAPNPMRDWFQANEKAIQYFDFNNGVHLVLFRGGAS